MICSLPPTGGRGQSKRRNDRVIREKRGMLTMIVAVMGVLDRADTHCLDHVDVLSSDVVGSR
jgi:hypothetical protein